MYQNMNQPIINATTTFNSMGSEIKVGESGPVHWTKGAYCQKQYSPQLSASIWNPSKLELRHKIQAELLQQREVLGLRRDANRMNYACLPVYLSLLVGLIIYIVALNNAVDNDEYTDIEPYIFFYLLYTFGMIFLMFVIVCYSVAQMTKKVHTSICFLNQKLSQEGLNVTIVTRRKCPFPSVFNFSHFDIYERINQ